MWPSPNTKQKKINKNRQVFIFSVSVSGLVRSWISSFWSQAGHPRSRQRKSRTGNSGRETHRRCLCFFTQCWTLCDCALRSWTDHVQMDKFVIYSSSFDAWKYSGDPSIEHLKSSFIWILNKYSVHLNNEHLNNSLKLVWFLDVRYSNGGLNTRPNIARYSDGIQMAFKNLFAFGQLLTIWIPG